MRIRSCPTAATNSYTGHTRRQSSAAVHPSTARLANSRPTSRPRSARKRVTALAIWHSPRITRNLYVLNEFVRARSPQYAVDAGKGTLTLVDSISSVPAEAGLVWGAAQGAGRRSRRSASTAPKDEKPKVWAAEHPDHRQRQISVREASVLPTRSPIFTVGTPKRASSPTSSIVHDRGTAARNQDRSEAANISVASGEKSDRLSVYKIDQSQQGSWASPVATRSAMARIGWSLSTSSERH